MSHSFSLNPPTDSPAPRHLSYAPPPTHALGRHPIAVQSAAATLHNLLVVDSYRPIIGSKRDIAPEIAATVDQGRAQGPVRHRSVPAELTDRSRPAAVLTGAQGRRVGIVEDATTVIAQIAGCE
ncbi:unnamed protein product [Linum tenue]|uniref:Uncharacterized protein n=1 Tax=Linum tenue TaxID=586396 RepID=A0AAV0L271_9ROSI|nr:unnamed protein product [Linum tenue]